MTRNYIAGWANLILANIHVMGSNLIAFTFFLVVSLVSFYADYKEMERD